MLILLGGCAGDFGRPQSLWVTDEALAIEVGQPLRHVTLPITIYGRTDDEKSLRKYAYPLLVPPYQNERLLRLPIDFDYAAAVVGLGPGYDPGS